MHQNQNAASGRIVNEALLRSEVAFWRELIAASDLAVQPSASIERMHQALALAESRLAGLFADHEQGDSAPSSGSARIYHLDPGRR